MTVKEVIEALSKFPPEMEVLQSDSDWGTTSIEEIREIRFNPTDAYTWEVDEDDPAYETASVAALIR